jgi:DNA-binding MarR family transcriptional regulator
MLKAQDIVVLMKLVGQSPGWTFEQIAHELGLSQSSVHRSLKRAQSAGLYNSKRKEVNRSELLEFLIHGARFVFPVKREGEARGIPTAWAAPPLSKQLSSARENVPVWPYARGKARGIALEPLHQVVPEATRKDRQLAELLALFDAIRIGNARERNLASKELGKRLREPALA